MSDWKKINLTLNLIKIPMELLRFCLEVIAIFTLFIVTEAKYAQQSFE